MGADIHLVVERDDSPDFRQPEGVAFLGWPRQTDLFVALAGLWNRPCLIPARGFPEPASWLAYEHYARQVVRSNDWEATLDFRSIREDEALAAIESGRSRVLPFLKDFISDPAYEWASWLTRDEVQRCLTHSKIEYVPLECTLALLMMEEIEKRGFHARIAFWFDS